MRDEDLSAIRERVTRLSEYLRERGYDQEDEAELPFTSSILRLAEDVSTLIAEVESLRGYLDQPEAVVERVRRDLALLDASGKLDLLKALSLPEE